MLYIHWKGDSSAPERGNGSRRYDVTPKNLNFQQIRMRGLKMLKEPKNVPALDSNNKLLQAIVSFSIFIFQMLEADEVQAGGI